MKYKISNLTDKLSGIKQFRKYKCISTCHGCDKEGSCYVYINKLSYKLIFWVVYCSDICAYNYLKG